MSDDEQAYRRARAQFAVAHMSNAKWVELFRACLASGVTIERALWRVIGSEHTFTEPLPTEGDLLVERFADGRFQLLEYKWIRSIFIPREYRVVERIGATRTQDVTRLCAALEAAGSFPIVEREDGLTIVAYE